MLNKIRTWLYILFMVSFAVLGIAESLVVEDTVFLFDYIPIPAVPKIILPLITCAFFIIWVLAMLLKLGNAADKEERGNEVGTLESTTRLYITAPTVCTFFSFVGIFMLDAMQDNLVSWQYARDVYSYGILWLCFYPCLSFILEFVQGIIGFPEWDEKTNKQLKKAQTMDGLVSSILSFINLGCLIVIANMTVCRYSYIFLAAIFIYRCIRFSYLTTALWTEQPAAPLNEIDQKEGIL